MVDNEYSRRDFLTGKAVGGEIYSLEQDERARSDKLRSLYLSALMVMSVTAGSAIVFYGGADDEDYSDSTRENSVNGTATGNNSTATAENASKTLNGQEVSANERLEGRF